MARWLTPWNPRRRVEVPVGQRYHSELSAGRVTAVRRRANAVRGIALTR